MALGRAEIVAQNENQFRAFNERLGTAPQAGVVEILCECGRASCRAPLRLDSEEYRAVRAHPRRFLIAAGHEQPEVEEVVARRPGYFVVEKPIEVAHILEDGAGDGAAESFAAELTYVWTSSDELEFAAAGEVGRRLPVAHALVIPLARHQGRRVRVTVRDGVVVDWAPAP